MKQKQDTSRNWYSCKTTLKTPKTQVQPFLSVRQKREITRKWHTPTRKVPDWWASLDFPELMPNPDKDLGCLLATLWPQISDKSVLKATKQGKKLNALYGEGCGAVVNL